MKNNIIYSIYENLIELSNKELPVKVSFSIARNITILQPIVNDIYTQRMGIIIKYKDPEDPTRIETDYIGICNQELEELANIDMDVNLMKIKLSDLPEDLTITPQQLIVLQDIIEEEI